MKKPVVYLVCRNAIWMIVCAFTLTVFALNFFYTSSVSYNGEKVSIILDVSASVIALFVIAAVVGVASWFRDRIADWNTSKMFAVLSAIYIALGFYLVFNVDTTIRADAQLVYNAALQSKAGDYSSFQVGEYLYRFPRQLGMVLWDRLLAGISENTRLNFLTNLALVLGINYICGKISWELFKNKLVYNVTLILCFAFLPQLFFILFAYGLIPGYFFLIFAFYQAIKFVELGKYRNMLCITVGIAISVLLKQNNMIGAMAIILYLGLNLLKSRKIRWALAIILIAASMVMPGKLIESYYEEKADVQFDNAVPATVWLSMGTDIDNTQRGPGWYDGTPVTMYREMNGRREDVAAVAKARLASNLSKIQAEPRRAAVFFRDKMISQWCDPMYQSVWSGPLVSCGQNTYTELLQSIYNGGIVEDIIARYGKVINLALWGFAALFLILFGKRMQGWEMIYTSFVGGLLYHMACEAKSQYVYVYVFSLIPFAAYVLCCLIDKCCAGRKHCILKKVER